MRDEINPSTGQAKIFGGHDLAKSGKVRLNI